MLLSFCENLADATLLQLAIHAHLSLYFSDSVLLYRVAMQRAFWALELTAALTIAFLLNNSY